MSVDFMNFVVHGASSSSCTPLARRSGTHSSASTISTGARATEVYRRLLHLRQTTIDLSGSGTLASTGTSMRATNTLTTAVKNQEHGGRELQGPAPTNCTGVRGVATLARFCVNVAVAGTRGEFLRALGCQTRVEDDTLV